jgi:hypothetical protein
VVRPDFQSQLLEHFDRMLAQHRRCLSWLVAARSIEPYWTRRIRCRTCSSGAANVSRSSISARSARTLVMVGDLSRTWMERTRFFRTCAGSATKEKLPAGSGATAQRRAGKRGSDHRRFLPAAAAPPCLGPGCGRPGLRPAGTCPASLAGTAWR